MSTMWIILGSLLIFLVLLLIIAFVYIIFILRKANIIVQKVDYLVEDVSYKMEALTPTVELVNKVSNYGLAADAIANKSLKNFIKVFLNNKSSFLVLFQKFTDILSKTWDRTTQQASKGEGVEDNEPIIVDDDLEQTATNTKVKDAKDQSQTRTAKKTTSKNTKKKEDNLSSDQKDKK